MHDHMQAHMAAAVPIFAKASERMLARMAASDEAADAVLQYTDDGRGKVSTRD